MHSAHRAPLPGAGASVRRRPRATTLPLTGLDLSPQPSAAAPAPGADDLVDALQRRFGELSLCAVPARRRRQRGVRGWLAATFGRRRRRFDLAREIASMHAGSRWTRGAIVSGTTAAFSMPELFTMVRSGAKSGVIGVELGPEDVSLHVDRGQLVDGRSTNPPPEARLGAILLRKGLLSRKALRATLVRARRDGERLGARLLREELVSRGELEEALREQRRLLLGRVQDAPAAAFVFRECEVEPRGDAPRQDLEQLLLDSARERDEEAFRAELAERLRAFAGDEPEGPETPERADLSAA